MAGRERERKSVQEERERGIQYVGRKTQKEWKVGKKREREREVESKQEERER